MVLVLSENWTMTPARDLRALVRMAVEAEEAGFDAVMLSEHIVLGPSAEANGPMPNPREYALPGNQESRTPWPSSLVLLGAIAAVTANLRLFAVAVIPPLRHPLALAKDLATLDLLSEGRLVALPTVSWHEDEYAALGVPFGERGARLDEHLEAWHAVWASSPASHHGRHYAFHDVYLEPKPYSADGRIALHFGAGRLHDRLLRRIVRYGSGWNPLGRPGPEEVERLRAAMAAAGRRFSELELVGGTRAVFPDATSVADLDVALAAIPEQMEQGFTTFCIKPSQFIDDGREVGAFCRDVMERVGRLTRG
jgi:probable F420-dependent oxidoreductase